LLAHQMTLGHKPIDVLQMPADLLIRIESKRRELK
jgi:hypothetical protein